MTILFFCLIIIYTLYSHLVNIFNFENFIIFDLTILIYYSKYLIFTL